MIREFLKTLVHYLVEVGPALAIGLVISGLVHEYLPQKWVNRYLSKKGIAPILLATIAGIILPLCCFGSLPIAIGLKKKGVALGPVLAFLVATPATSITAVAVTYKLLGLNFTVYLCLSVIIMGLLIGIIGNMLPYEPKVEVEGEKCPHCAEGDHKEHKHHKKGFINKVVSVVYYAYDMLTEMWLELVIGLVIAAVVAGVVPVGNFIKVYLSGGFGYAFALIFGLIMYICSTASVPMVHAFVAQGMSAGAGLVLLIAGPVTSYGALLVVRKEFGNRILLVYLGVVCISALVMGYLFSFI